MRINYNISAIITNDCLARSESLLSDSTEKLSSGYKINHAKDNPSGIALSKRMHAQIRGLSRASQNASDGVSVIETAEGALTEVHDMLQRLNELSIKSANGTMSDSDRQTVQEEADALIDEINRIATSTEFNGSVLLDGTFDLKGFVEKSPNDVNFDTSAVKVESYSDEASIGYYEISFQTMTDADGKLCIDKNSVQVNTQDDTTTVHDKKVDLKKVDNCKATEAYTVDDGCTVMIKGDGAFSLTLDFDLEKLEAQGLTGGIFVVDLTGIGAMTMQIGSNEGQTLDIRIPTVSPKTLGIEDLDVSTKDAAKTSIDRVSGAIDIVSSIRSRLGAYQNRLEHSISSLDITEENMTAAYSRIMDVDMAEEMTEYTTNQVLSQAGTSMLAQANERPSQVLQLLQ